MDLSLAFSKDRKSIAKVLLIVAAFQLLLGGLYGCFYWQSLGPTYWEGWVFVFSAPIYLILWVAVRWIGYFSLLIGFALYLYLTFTVHSIPYARSGFWQDGHILQLPILIFLLWALLAGTKWRQPAEEWRTLLTAILLVLCGYVIQSSIHSIIDLHALTENLQKSLIGASEMPKNNRMTQIADIFCKANSSILRKLTIASFALGVSGLGLVLVLTKSVVRAIKDKRVSEKSA